LHGRGGGSHGGAADTDEMDGLNASEHAFTLTGLKKILQETILNHGDLAAGQQMNTDLTEGNEENEVGLLRFDGQ
jgi:hypothetical protein